MKLTAGTRRERSVRFASTHWIVVLRCAADQQETPQGRGALEEFCQTYWAPVYASLLRCGHPPADAQDLTQGFFALLLHWPSFTAVDPVKGKFRTFLLTALHNFLADHHDRQRTIKRGGEFRLVTLSGALVQTTSDTFIDPTGAGGGFFGDVMVGQGGQFGNITVGGNGGTNVSVPKALTSILANSAASLFAGPQIVNILPTWT